jgi:FtsZ-binding cell division protein ZapB
MDKARRSSVEWQLNDASDRQANYLCMLGENAAAMTRLSWVLGVAADPSRRSEIAKDPVPFWVAVAYGAWVDAARMVPELPAERLLAVLDAGEAYVRSVGQPLWRAGLLQYRAQELHEEHDGLHEEHPELHEEHPELREEHPELHEECARQHEEYARQHEEYDGQHDRPSTLRTDARAGCPCVSAKSARASKARGISDPCPARSGRRSTGASTRTPRPSRSGALTGT